MGALPRCRAKAWAVGRLARDRELEVLYRCNGAQALCIASLTKISTALTVLRVARLIPGLLDEPLGVSRRVSANHRVRDSRYDQRTAMQASRTIGTTARLQQGDTLRVWDCLFGMMLPSGNDAATALAQYVGFRAEREGITGADLCVVHQGATAAPGTGEAALEVAQLELLVSQSSQLAAFRRAPEATLREWEKHFVSLMNAMASHCGCSDTYFRNPHGLDERPVLSHHSNAVDQVRISAAAIREPLFRLVAGTCRYFCPVLTRRGASPSSSCSSAASTASSGDNEAVSDCGGSVVSLGSILEDDSPLCEESCEVEQREWCNTHKIVTASKFPAVDVGKTGVTPAAGPSLMTSCRIKGGGRLVAVVLGGRDRDSRYADTIGILKWASKLVAQRSPQRLKPKHSHPAEPRVVSLPPLFSSPRHIAPPRVATPQRPEALSTPRVQIEFGGMSPQPPACPPPRSLRLRPRGSFVARRHLPSRVNCSRH
jgi:D-alanyl-D-alanine carboxypeptidase